MYRAKSKNPGRRTLERLVQREQFKECGSDLEEQYKRYGNTEAFFAEVIEPGHIYEIGCPKCVCPDVLSGKISDAAHWEYFR